MFTTILSVLGFSGMHTRSESRSYLKGNEHETRKKWQTRERRNSCIAQKHILKM